jgi:hypothetical protein
MRSHAALAINRLWKRHRHKWPFALLTSMVLLLSWMVLLLAKRAGLFGWSGSLSADEVKLFPMLVVGGLGTAATLFAQLITRDYNKREQHRQRLETIIKSLESLPTEASKPHMAGVLSTMVLLGQQRVAIRVLGPAWDEDKVDDGTATWVINQVLIAAHGDEAAMSEASVLLLDRADRLTDVERNMYYFPGHFMRQWSTDEKLPRDAKDNLLEAMVRVLVSRDKDWWSPNGDPPEWPTEIWRECAKEDSDENIRSSAAALFAALYKCFPEQTFSPEKTAPILKLAAETCAAPEYQSLAKQISVKFA